MDLERRCTALVGELGLCRPDQVGAIRPLTGGVSSDIAAVEIPGATICVKFARAKLDVAEDWFAPVHRNRAEYAWLAAVKGISPRNVPQLFGWSERENGFAMAYLVGADVTLWKVELLAGRGLGQAETVAEVLGRLHAASALVGFDRAPFANRDDFYSLRIEPYLTFTAGKYPQIAKQISGMANHLFKAATVLVHGDVSPKNILFRGDDPIILDAECATMGDAAFDLAFCMNHLLLKSMHLQQPGLMDEAAAFWARYAAIVDWEDVAKLEGRTAHLLPMLMLARVDGKSPVEYLNADRQAQIRSLAVPLIAKPAHTIDDLIFELKTKAF